jgi:Rrf2 family protein
MEVTRRTDYAIRMLAALSRVPMGVHVSAADLACRQEVPHALARGILSDLARAGFVAGRKGAGGGMRLTRRPEEITLLSVIESVEGSVDLSLCTTEPDYCRFAEDCAMHQVWLDAEDLLKGFLAAHTLADLASGVGAMGGITPSAPDARRREG